MTKRREPAEPSVDQGPARALIYLRVSTKEQAARGGEAEGFSIPTQREACYRKAEALGASVVDEFVDAGESARSADRPELQRLLKFVAHDHVDYLIVHKIDRLARNRLDDLAISLALEEAGVQLVSCTENIDKTPSGKLTHGLMALIAEWYSTNLSSEVRTKTLQKVRAGGTVGKAPIGYLNVRRKMNGREIRTVELDPDRAPLVLWGYEAYSSGEWTIAALVEELEARGLTTVPTAHYAERALGKSAVHRMLRNRYYIGKVTWDGVEYDGNHPHLVDRALFDQVQALLTAKNFAGDKQRVHTHYLKGSVFCGQCGFRMIVSHAKNRWGTVYPYFICLGRQQKRSECTQKAVLIEDVERFVEGQWQSAYLAPEYAELLRTMIEAELSEYEEKAEKDRRRAVRRIQRLGEQRRKLLDAHYADAMPLDLFRDEQQRLTKEMDGLQSQLEKQVLEREYLLAALDRCLALVTDCGGTYLQAGTDERRQMNQAMYQRFEVTEEGVVRAELSETYAVLLRPDLLVATEAEATESVIPVTDVEARHEHRAWHAGWPAWLRVSHWWERIADSIRRGPEPAPALALRGLGLNMNYVVRRRGLEPRTHRLRVCCSSQLS